MAETCVDCGLFQCDECAANYDDRSCCCGRIVSYPDDDDFDAEVGEP